MIAAQKIIKDPPLQWTKWRKFVGHVAIDDEDLPAVVNQNQFPFT